MGRFACGRAIVSPQLAFKATFGHPDLPWEMRLELADQMWDEARHIENVAKVVEEELDGELGYGCDYLQAEERMHVRLATDWIRRLADPERQDDLVRWGRAAVARVEGFYAGEDYEGADDVRFTFMKDGGRDEHHGLVVIGE